MRIEDAVGFMSKAYLHRVIDSFTKDLHKPEEEQARELIRRNAEELSDEAHVRAKIRRRDIPLHEQVLMHFLLESLLAAPDHRLSEAEVIEAVGNREQSLIDQGTDSAAFKYKDTKAVETYRVVLEVALEDDVISEDEDNLLTRLRRHLGLRERDHYLIQANLGKFPQPGNAPHEPSRIKNALTELQKRGVVFYCNRAQEGDPFYVIPEEIVDGVKTAIGLELNDRAYRLLLEHLEVKQLRQLLSAFSLPTSGNKHDQAARLLEAGVRPSEALGQLGSDDLYEFCKKLPGVNVSGSKQKRIDNIIAHFDKLKTVDVGKEADERERYYHYYEELANRDRENLLSNKVITKDRDMDGAFEQATKYLFEAKLGLQHEPVEGSEHPDGVLPFDESGTRFMWDTKSKETHYDFPNPHLNQFKRYIRDSARRVACFLVIAPTIQEKAVENALRLKAESGTDTDVALMAAADLKWLAENWKDSGKPSEHLNLQVLNYTGILTRELLKQRLTVFQK